MYEQERTDQEGYELFRRAIEQRDGDAWSEIYTRYRPLLLAWARQYSVCAATGNQYEDIADRALSRAWLALRAEHFGHFPGLVALLAYLRTCVAAAVIDATRAQATRERAYQKLDATSVGTPEEQVVNANSRAELWKLLNSLVSNPHERIVLVESFVLALPPRAIFDRHHDCFADVLEIYSLKRNLLNRLERNHDLQQLYQELFLE
jgi:RNA polymerase sigma factor (sigma-70 family)